MLVAEGNQVDNFTKTAVYADDLTAADAFKELVGNIMQTGT